MSAFVDTNILLYAVLPDPSNAAKRAIARTILAADNISLSMQVVQEFTAQATRPTRANALSLDEAERMVAVWRRFPVLPTTLELYDLGIALMRRYRLSYWDSMIVAAAKLQGCETLFSEDMQDGLHIDGLTIRNPFA